MASERVFTNHGLTRMAQRGITKADVDYVLAHGLCIQRGGAQHVHLRAKDIPASDQRQYDHRHGIQVLLDPAGQVVVTVYKNRARDVLVKVRRKSKYNRKVSHGVVWQ